MAAIAALFAGAASGAVAQNALLRGTVRSDVAELVDGATVLIPELAIQTATLANGQFLISVAGARVRGQEVTLVVRMIGFRPWRQAATLLLGEQTFDIRLVADVNRLEDIVVTGVMEGTPQTQTTFTVARVDLSDASVPAADPLRQLAGRVPGMSVISSTGRPGASPDVLLRGPTSINATGRSQNPLYIIDGVIIGGTGGNDWGSAIPSINTQDIETIEVVKGAAGASLYGARAANGVINITTKSGRRAAEGISLRFRTEAGLNDIERDLDRARQHPLLMDQTGQRFCIRDTSQPLCARSVDWNRELARINNAPGTGAALPASLAYDPSGSSAVPPLRQVFQAGQWPGRTYDAVRQVTTSQPFVNTNVEAAGRVGGMRYMASSSLLRQQGAFRYLKGSRRYTARLNVDQQIGANLSLSLRTFYSQSTSWDWGQDLGGSLFFNVAWQPAGTDLLARDTLGRLYVRTSLRSGNGQYNPLWYSAAFGVKDVRTGDRFLGGGTLRWAAVPWADVEANFSYDYGMNFWSYLVPKGIRSATPTDVSYRGSLQDWAFGGYAYNASLNLTARHRLGRDVAVRWQFRYLFQQEDQHLRQMSGNTLAVAGVEVANNATANQTIASSFQSQRLIGLFGGVSVDFRQRLFGDVLLRRDGSSLFGAGNRWASFGRASLAYRPSQEPWWPFRDGLNEFKLRASYGTAGGRPSFAAQYETYAIGSGGALNASTLGNRNLRPEINTEREVGADLELFRRVGVTLTYAHSDTRNQILLVPAPVASGFSSQWRNAGTLTNKTWELSVNVPVVRRRDLDWSWRFNYDRTRTVITRLDVAPFYLGWGFGSNDIFRIAEGERYGTIYGHWFLRGTTDCTRLPAPFDADCGAHGSAFQVNDEGWLVWTGGYDPGEGLSRNLWMTQLPAASSPWGVALNWGMPITLRDSTGAAARAALGSGLPSWRFSVSQTLRFRRLTVYALLEGVMGRSLWNYGRRWAYLMLYYGDADQRGKDPEHAKPIGYYWRSAPPEGSGIGGFYHDGSLPTNKTVEDGSYAKLRELSLSYRLGAVGGFGDWEVSLIGRNLFTLTRYTGFDPETGVSAQNWGIGSQLGSAMANAIDFYTFPNLRTLTLALSTSF